MSTGTIGFPHPVKNDARRPAFPVVRAKGSLGSRASFALFHAECGPACLLRSSPSASESQIEAGDQTMNLGSHGTPGRRPRRKVMFPPRLPPITALILFLAPGLLLSS